MGSCALALSAGTAAAQSARIDCGAEPYTIQSGDTLRAIAIRAYGRGNFDAIYNANRDVLSNPSLLRVGQRIVIPCPGDAPAAAPAEAAGPATAEAARPSIVFQPAVTVAREPAPAPAAPASAGLRTAALDPAAPETAAATLRLLAASDLAPFVGRDRPEGGMLTEILGRALLRRPNGGDHAVSFDADRSAHLTQMLPQGTFDIAFPWPRPDCARPSQLDREQKWQCSDFTFSAPLYETEIGFYFRADDETALASDPGLMFGRRLCRPAGDYAEDLEAEALVAPNVERVSPATARDCFDLLAAGQVDAVSVAVEIAGREIAAAGLGGQVVRAEMLGTTLSLHAVALNTNAAALAALTQIDMALAQMRQDGEWAEVVARHQALAGLAAR